MNPLSAYRKKRKASETPEPQGRAPKASKDLIFVVQKHQASHLHYDLRLELDGVLKSWAVPKGPSIHPEDKRLAIMVEDHPYEYKDFAGIIPKGNYGAGTVTIWDKGTYTVEGVDSKSEIEKYMRAGLKKGHVNVRLKGKKLRGEFVLVKTRLPGQENAWLLFAKSKPDPKEPKKKAKPTKAPDPIPERITPMLAQLAGKAFNRKEWIFEVKWDGYRAIAKISPESTQLISRNQVSFNKQFPLIVEELQALKEHEPILDGEVVILDSQGKSNFQLMQNYKKTKTGNLFYYVFDLLYCDGQDLRDRPLIERKEKLEVLLAPLKKTRIRYSDHIEEKGVRFFNEAKKLGLEGIMAKNAQSSYQMKRSADWQKIKTHLRQEVVIGGFTEPRKSREKFGALMVGVYEGKSLVYVGHVGTGFSEQTLKDVALKLAPLVQSRSPFISHPKPNAPVTYVKPRLVCEVSFAEWTSDGNMRHPVFEGLRTDKDAKSVKREHAHQS